MENLTIEQQNEIKAKSQAYYTMGRQQGRIAEYGASKEERGAAIELCTFYNNKAKEGGEFAPMYEAFVQGFSDAYYSMD